MTGFLDWLAQNKDALTILGGAIAAVAAAIWAVYRFRVDKKPASNSSSAGAIAPSTAAGQVVQFFGIPFGDFAAILSKREAEIRAELESASASRAMQLSEAQPYPC